MILAAEPLPPLGSVWRHRERKACYAVGHICEGQGQGIEGETVVVYTGADGRHWVSRLDEFLARFEKAAA